MHQLMIPQLILPISGAKLLARLMAEARAIRDNPGRQPGLWVMRAVSGGY